MKISCMADNEAAAKRASKILEQLNGLNVQDSEEVLGNVIVIWSKVAKTEQIANALIFDLFRFVVECKMIQAPVEKVKE